MLLIVIICYEFIIYDTNFLHLKDISYPLNIIDFNHHLSLLFIIGIIHNLIFKLDTFNKKIVILLKICKISNNITINMILLKINYFLNNNLILSATVTSTWACIDWFNR